MDILTPFARNPHTLDDSWWDGSERFQYVNRNVISGVQNEDLFKFVKIFSPQGVGLHIGASKKRINYLYREDPITYTLDIIGDCDIFCRGENLAFQDETISHIISFHTLEHIKGSPYLTLLEWLRVLTPHGIIGLSMPDKNYFLHDANNKKDGIVAYHEMFPEQLLEICKKLPNVKILLFNNRLNNFDFDVVLQKED